MFAHGNIVTQFKEYKLLRNCQDLLFAFEHWLRDINSYDLITNGSHSNHYYDAERRASY